MTEIHTPRLLLRRWYDHDLFPLAEFTADPDVMRWVGDGGTLDADATAETIERWEEEWDDEGFGVFAVELLASGELAGAVGLSVPRDLPEFASDIAVGWCLGRPFWGQGYASEAAHATLEFALQDRGLDRVISLTRPGDEASESVLAKLGMTPVRVTEDPAHGLPLRVHAIDLSEYEA